MTALDHITAGRTARNVLLIAIVLIGGLAGTGGTAAAEPMDGKGDDPYPDDRYLSLDGKGNDVVHFAFPINNFTVTSASSRAMLAFPINNATRLGTQSILVVLPQDMDPY